MMSRITSVRKIDQFTATVTDLLQRMPIVPTAAELLRFYYPDAADEVGWDEYEASVDREAERDAE